MNSYGYKRVKDMDELFDAYVIHWDQIAQSSIQVMKNLLDANLAIQRVRELHKPEPRSSWNPDDPLPEVCRFCRYVGEAIPELGDVYVYPCPTIKALDGEQ